VEFCTNHVAINFNEIKSVLKTADQESRLSNIDLVVVEALIKFLTPFQEATNALEGDCYTTIQHVYLWKMKLTRFLEKSTCDFPLIAFLKRKALCALRAKFEIDLLHKLALFFNPKFKSLRPLDLAEKEEVYALARSLISKLPNVVADSSEMPTSSHQTIDHVYGRPPTDTYRTNIVSSIDDEFLDWQDAPQWINNKDEVKMYVAYVFEDEFTNTFFNESKFEVLVIFHGKIYFSTIAKSCSWSSQYTSIKC